MTRGRKLSWRGYAGIYAALQAAPASARAIGARFGVSVQTAYRVLERMRDCGFAHRAEFRSEVPRGKRVPLYAAGPGREPVPPPYFKPRSNLRHNAVPEVVAACNLLRLLRQPIAMAQLAAEAGSSPASVGRFIGYCAKQLGILRIAAWDCTRPGRPAALWCLRGGRNAPRPKPKSRSQINREYRLGRQAKQHQLTVLRALALRPCANAPAALAA